MRGMLAARHTFEAVCRAQTCLVQQVFELLFAEAGQPSRCRWSALCGDHVLCRPQERVLQQLLRSAQACYC